MITRVCACVCLFVRPSVCPQYNSRTIFTWSAQSPDINVIENVWMVIKVHVQKDLSHIKSRQDLIESVLKAWSKLHRNYIRQLYESDVFVLLLHRKVL